MQGKKGAGKGSGTKARQALGAFANLLNVSSSLKLAYVAKQDSSIYADDAQ
jgi:hypothetical protein